MKPAVDLVPLRKRIREKQDQLEVLRQRVRQVEAELVMLTSKESNITKMLQPRKFEFRAVLAYLDQEIAKTGLEMKVDRHEAKSDEDDALMVKFMHKGKRVMSYWPIRLCGVRFGCLDEIRLNSHKHAVQVARALASGEWKPE